MAIENDFTKAIEKAFAGRQGKGDHRLVPSVSKRYNAPSASKTLTIENAQFEDQQVSPENKVLKTDLDIFTYLVGVKPMTSGVGFGEVAIYWLYNYSYANRQEDGLLKKEMLKLNQGGNEPDLKFATGPAMEVKAYESATMVSLGRYKDSLRTFIDLTAPILGIRNLVRSGTVTLLNMNHENLVEASSDFCDLRGAIMSLPKARREKYDIFKNMIKKFEEFDALANNVGLKDCTHKEGGLQPGGEYIAYRLSQYAISEATKVKPGDGQYMCIVAGAKGKFDKTKGVILIKLNQEDISEDPKVLEKGYKFKGGAFSVDFKSVFGQ